jgi:hypothetical protein
MTKSYHAEKGVAIDDTFAHHLHNCARCRQFDAAKPATVALLCLEGAVLWKRENGVKVTPEREQKKETIVSKVEAQKAMRYKS